MKKGIILFIIIFVLSLAGCGKKNTWWWDWNWWLTDKPIKEVTWVDNNTWDINEALDIIKDLLK